MTAPVLRLHADADPARGAGDPRPVLVLLHGFSQDGGTWTPVREALRAAGPAGTRTVALDLVGHGASPAPDDPAAYTMPACVAQVAAALDALALRPVWLLGYSMGGRVALHLALHLARHRPERLAGLVLASTTGGLDDPGERAARRRSDEALAARIEAEGVAAFVEHWLALPLFAGLRALPPETFAAIRARRLRNRAHGLAYSLRGMGTGAMAPVWDRLGALDVPALVLAGAHDERFVALAGRLAAGLPRARLRIVPGAGHSLHLERPDAFAREVTAFLAEVAARGAPPR